MLLDVGDDVGYRLADAFLIPGDGLQWFVAGGVVKHPKRQRWLTRGFAQRSGSSSRFCDFLAIQASRPGATPAPASYPTTAGRQLETTHARETETLTS